jgi:S-formylglutathione hydrolase FrmB
MIAGISMGGHGAIQLSLNNPGIYSAIGAHSPVFRTQEQATEDYPLQFGTGLDFQNRDPISLMTIQGKRITVPIYVDMGAEDPWLSNTVFFSNYLTQVGFTGETQVAEDPIGGHVNAYWSYHLGSYVDWYSTHLPSPK